MYGIILAALIQLAPGMNNIGQSGEVVAVNAATAEAAATVNLQKVSTFTTYSNIVDEVVSFETAYHVNYYGDGVEYSLPDDCFPITFLDGNGQTNVTLSADDVMFAERGDNLVHLEVKSGSAVCGFVGGVYSDHELTIENLLFGGVAPQVDVSPVLTQGPQIIYTNVVGYVDWDAFKDTNGVQRIVGEPVRFDLATTNEVVTGQAIANVYVATNDLATVTTENHFGTVTTNGYLTGEAILVSGAADGDRINILTK